MRPWHAARELKRVRDKQGSPAQSSGSCAIFRARFKPPKPSLRLEILFLCVFGEIVCISRKGAKIRDKQAKGWFSNFFFFRKAFLLDFYLKLLYPRPLVQRSLAYDCAPRCSV